MVFIKDIHEQIVSEIECFYIYETRIVLAGLNKLSFCSLEEKVFKSMNRFDICEKMQKMTRESQLPVVGYYFDMPMDWGRDKQAVCKEQLLNERFIKCDY